MEYEIPRLVVYLICRHIAILVTVRQKWQTLYMKTYVHLSCLTVNVFLDNLVPFWCSGWGQKSIERSKHNSWAFWLQISPFLMYSMIH